MTMDGVTDIGKTIRNILTAEEAHYSDDILELSAQIKAENEPEVEPEIEEELVEVKLTKDQYNKLLNLLNE